jgi:hypothetical protein
VISLMFAGLGYVIAGATLGTFIVGLFAVAIVVPMMVAGESCLRRRAAIGGSCVAVVFAIWICAMVRLPATVTQAADAGLILASFAVTVLSVEWIIKRLRVPPPLAGALAVVAAITWLTWPIWASAWIRAGMRPATMGWIVSMHPVLALNGVLTATPPWTEQAIAYRLTALNQDVPIALPHSPWWCAIPHGVLAVVFLLNLRRRRGIASVPSAPKS